jgi:hypothetical protein
MKTIGIGHLPRVAVIAIGAVVCGLVGGIGGIALAGNSDPAVISACKMNATGLVRIVPAGQGCHHNETAVQWNVQGPQGPAGQNGVSGEKIVEREKTFQVNAGDGVGYDVTCPDGKKAVGGGGFARTSDDSVTKFPLTESIPMENGGVGSWQVIFGPELGSSTGQPVTVTVGAYAICVAAS